MSRLDEEEGTSYFDLDPEEGARELAKHFPIYVYQLRASGVREGGSSASRYRGVKLVVTFILQVLHGYTGYALNVQVLGYTKIVGWAYVLGVVNSMGKLFATALFIEPPESPSASDAAFVGLRENDWRLLAFVRVFVLFMPISAMYMGLHFVIVALVWPETFAGYWWALPPYLVGFLFGSMPWWFGVTGHFILASVATMLQLRGLRDELEIVVSDAEGSKTAQSWRHRSLSRIISSSSSSTMMMLNHQKQQQQPRRRQKSINNNNAHAAEAVLPVMPRMSWTTNDDDAPLPVPVPAPAADVDVDAVVGSKVRGGGVGDGGDGDGLKDVTGEEGSAVNTTTKSSDDDYYDSRVRWFRGAHSCMDDQLQRFSYAWQFYVLVVEFLILTVLLLYYVSLASDTWRRADYDGPFPRQFALANLLYMAVMLSTILPMLAGLTGFITFFADKLPRTVSRLAAHRAPELRELREELESRVSGFYLMGSRVTLHVLLTMFYLALTTAIGVGYYLFENTNIIANAANDGAATDSTAAAAAAATAAV